MMLRRAWRAIGWALAATIVWMSLTPHPITVPVAEGDKLGHLAAYGTLMFWFAQLHRRPGARLACAIAFVALGVSLEFAQRLTDYRVFEYADMVANAAGVMAGWIVSPPRGPDLFDFIERALVGVG